VEDTSRYSNSTMCPCPIENKPPTSNAGRRRRLRLTVMRYDEITKKILVWKSLSLWRKYRPNVTTTGTSERTGGVSDSCLPTQHSMMSTCLSTVVDSCVLVHAWLNTFQVKLKRYSNGHVPVKLKRYSNGHVCQGCSANRFEQPKD